MLTGGGDGGGGATALANPMVLLQQELATPRISTMVPELDLLLSGGVQAGWLTFHNPSINLPSTFRADGLAHRDTSSTLPRHFLDTSWTACRRAGSPNCAACRAWARRSWRCS